MTGNDLLIDRILSCGPQDVVLCDESVVVKVRTQEHVYPEPIEVPSLTPIHLQASNERSEFIFCFSPYSPPQASLVISSGIAFFSGHRVSALTNRIGTDGLRELVENLDNLIRKRVCENNNSRPMIEFWQPVARVDLASNEAKAFIQGQFQPAAGYD